MLLADGDPRVVSPGNMIRSPALKEQKILFVYSEQFRATHKLLYNGLNNCKGLQDARWVCKKEEAPPSDIRVAAGQKLVRLLRQCDLRDFLLSTSSLSEKRVGFRAQFNDQLQF